jgi:hypothetical protein
MKAPLSEKMALLFTFHRAVSELPSRRQRDRSATKARRQREMSAKNNFA